MAGKTEQRSWFERRGPQIVATTLTVLLVIAVVAGAWAVITWPSSGNDNKPKNYPWYLVAIALVGFAAATVLDVKLREKGNPWYRVSEPVRVLYSGSGATWAFIGALILGITSPPPFADWLNSWTSDLGWLFILGASLIVVGFSTWLTLSEAPPGPRRFKRMEVRVKRLKASSAEKRSELKGLEIRNSNLAREKDELKREVRVWMFLANKRRDDSSELARENADLKRQVRELKRERVVTLP